MSRVMTSLYLLIFCLGLGTKWAEGSTKCVWALGQVQCLSDRSKEANVEVRLLDRDSAWIFNKIDPDDMMGITFTEEHGHFLVGGCGRDVTWLPFVENDPEPYLLIRHYCNDATHGETLRLTEFRTFVPNTHVVGRIELDSPKRKLLSLLRKSFQKHKN